MSNPKKKRSRYLSEEEMSVLNIEKDENYIESWEEVMDLFLRDGELRGLREASLFYYTKESKMVFSYFKEQDINVKPYELTKDHIEKNIILYMKNVKNLSPETINIRIRAFKTILIWLSDKKLIPYNPAKNVKKLKTRVKEIEAFSTDHLNRFFNCIERNTWIGVRDMSICLVLLECGLRQNELLNLDVTDIIWEENYLLVRHTKTYRMRKVPITKDTKKALKRWLLIRGEVYTNKLFINISNNPLTNRGLYQLIEKYGKKAKIQGVRCSPHTFRHTCAKLYLKNKGDLFSLQQILGHTDINQTRRYVHFMHEDIAELHSKFSPLKSIKLNN